MKIKTPKMIWLKWIDPCFLNDGWGKPEYEDSPEGLICETVGFLAHETPKVYYVSLSIGYQKDSYDTRDTMVVPKSCVIKKKFLK